MSSFTEAKCLHNMLQSGKRLCLFIIMSFCILLYSQTLSYDLSWLDDYFLLIEAKPFLSELKNLPACFLTDAFITNPIGLYRPILNISFMADVALNGDSFFFSHLFNVLLHACSSCLFFLFLCRFSICKSSALMLSLLFAAHPASSAAVSWIPGRNDLLLALFVFPAFIFLDEFRMHGRLNHAVLYGIMLSAALFVKESAIALPPLCFLWLFLNRKNSKADKSFFLFVSILPILAWAGLRSLAYLGETSLNFAATLKNMAFLPALAGRAVLPIFPVLFSPYKLLGHYLLYSSAAIVFFVLLLLPIIVKKTGLWNNLLCVSKCVLAIGGNESAELNGIAENTVYFGLAWFFLFFIPTLAAGNGIVSGQLFFEHRLYVPMAGLMLSFLPFFESFSKRRKSLFVLMSAAVLFLAVISFCHSSFYKDRCSFWARAVQDSPMEFSNFVRAGMFEHKRLIYGAADYYYRKALELKPDQPQIHASLASIAYKRGDYIRAEEEMLAELALNPDYMQDRIWLEKLRKEKKQLIKK